MQSIEIPENTNIQLSSHFRRIVGPRGIQIFDRQGFNVNLFTVNGKKRLVVVPTTHNQPDFSYVASILSQLRSVLSGVHAGYRRRLRLSGVGFRAFSPQPSKIAFKLGYSHDVIVDTNQRNAKRISLSTSRLEGRAKGTLLCLEGCDRASLHH